MSNEIPGETFMLSVSKLLPNILSMFYFVMVFNDILATNK